MQCSFEVVKNTLGEKHEYIVVSLNEVPKQHEARGGKRDDTLDIPLVMTEYRTAAICCCRPAK